MDLVGRGADGGVGSRGSIRAVVEVEENVYSYTPADNGAGPMWCHGSTSLVRVGDEVYAAGLETIAGAKPLNNCRWTLWRRGGSGWSMVVADPSGRTREPAPLVVYPGVGTVFLSANPTLNGPDVAGAGPARPVILEFSTGDPGRPVRTNEPGWRTEPKPPVFTEHSYRSFAADGLGREMILFQNIDYTHAEWAFRDGEGQWAAQGQLRWPWGSEYDKPGPIRVCYPNVALRGRSVHFVGVSDIVEPYGKWREYKRELTGRQWDYDFRRLFYTMSTNILTGQFEPWIEIASRDKTCGWISPGDLWLGRDEGAHVVWTERAIDERLRARFFPEARQRHELNHAILRGGRVVSRRTLLAVNEGKPGLIASLPRLHETPEGRLLLFCYVQGTDEGGKSVGENRLMELGRDGVPGPWVRVGLEHPLTSYFAATPRAGSAPSKYLDLLGTRGGAANTISYARIRIEVE
jgi:hypothetical protein